MIQVPSDKTETAVGRQICIFSVMKKYVFHLSDKHNNVAVLIFKVKSNYLQITTPPLLVYFLSHENFFFQLKITLTSHTHIQRISDVQVFNEHWLWDWIKSYIYCRGVHKKKHKCSVWYQLCEHQKCWLKKRLKTVCKSIPQVHKNCTNNYSILFEKHMFRVTNSHFR